MAVVTYAYFCIMNAYALQWYVKLVACVSQCQNMTGIKSQLVPVLLRYHGTRSGCRKLVHLLLALLSLRPLPPPWEQILCDCWGRCSEPAACMPSSSSSIRQL